MHHLRFAPWLCMMLVALWANVALAGFNYNEAIDGDLTGNGMDPDYLVPIEQGVSILSGTVGEFDDDYFGIVIFEDDLFLSSIILASYSDVVHQTTSLMIEDDGIFGPGVFNSNAFGYVDFGIADVGSDILDDMAASNGNFTGPLGKGVYTFRLDESLATEAYTLQFVFTPEPASLLLLGVGGLMALRRKR